EVPAEPVLVLVLLPQAIELGGGLPPAPVDLGLGLGRAPFGGRGLAPGGGGRLERFLRSPEPVLGGRPGGLRGLELGPEGRRILGGQSLAFLEQGGRAGFQARPLAPEGLDG